MVCNVYTFYSNEKLEFVNNKSLNGNIYIPCTSGKHSVTEFFS